MVQVMAWWQIGDKPLHEPVAMHFIDVSRSLCLLTHLPPVPAYMSVNRVSIGLYNGLSPIRCQAIILTNSGLLSIAALGTISSEILIKIQNFSFKKINWKMLSAKWKTFCPWGRCRTGGNIYSTVRVNWVIMGSDNHDNDLSSAWHKESPGPMLIRYQSKHKVY